MEAIIEILFGWILGGVILDFIGACFNWIYFTIRASIAERSRVRLKDVISSSRLARQQQKLYGGLPNAIVGFIVVALSIALFIKLSLMFGW